MYKHYRLRDSKLAAWRSASGDTKTTKNKPRVDYEPRSAHGRAVNKLKKKIKILITIINYMTTHHYIDYILQNPLNFAP